MAESARRKLLSAALLTIILGFFAVAITDWPHGIISAGLVAVALIVAENL